MPEIVLRPSRRRRLPRRASLLTLGLAGATGLAGALVVLDDVARDVVVTMPHGPALLAPGGVGVGQPAERQAPHRRPAAPAAVDTTTPVASDDTSEAVVVPAVDLTVETPAPSPRPDPPAAPATPDPPDPTPPQPQPEPQPEPEPEPEPQPEEPNPVQDVVRDVTGITPVTEPVGDLIIDLLDPPAS